MHLAEEAFFKQRRSLIASSLLVTFLNIAGGELRTLNFLGNEIEFTNSRVIRIALGAMLTYFVVRYLQYAHDVEDKGFKKRFYTRVEWYLAPYVMKREFNRSNSSLGNCFEELKEIKVEGFTMFHEAMPPNTAAASFCGKDGVGVFGFIGIIVTIATNGHGSAYKSNFSKSAPPLPTHGQLLPGVRCAIRAYCYPYRYPKNKGLHHEWCNPLF